VKPTLRTKLDSHVGRLEELNRLLAAEDATKDLQKFKALSREHAELTGLVALYDQYRKAADDAQAAQELDMAD
jgi:peptide chain release factor 1